jgi:predicted alpha/beta superfamily hydrolase
VDGSLRLTESATGRVAIADSCPHPTRWGTLPITRIEAHYPARKGKLSLRGNVAPLAWTRSYAARETMEERSVFEIDLPEHEVLEFKFMRDERDWSGGRNFEIHAGETGSFHPYFDRSQGTLEHEIRTLASPELGRSIRFRVFLPPSYFEHEEIRYPVLYAQDAQALFSDTPDPIDGQSWHLDDALNELYDLGAAQEIIVVAIYTDEKRLEMLSPMPDPTYGGGGGPTYLAFLVETLKPVVDRLFRTLGRAADTAIMGASMGGLFAFFAAWTRPDVFGRAACISSSFWWNQRAMVREVQRGGCPVPRPTLYIDSGAARSPFEGDANVRDGYNHTAALRSALVGHCYRAGDDLHTLAFAGLSHNNASWATRIAIPLQLIFPRRA